MARSIRLAVIAVIAAFSVAGLGQEKSAAQIDVYATAGLANGRMWQIAPFDNKLTYLLGLADMNKALRESPSCKKAADEALPPNRYTNTDLVKALNQFYEEPANLNVPVVWAQFVAVMRLNGASAESIDRLISTFRNLSNKE